MDFFKYFLFTILILITQTSFAAYTCGVGANVTLTTDLQDYPSVICAITGMGNCEVIEDHSVRQSNGTWIIYAKSTGEGCGIPTNLNAPPLDDGCVRLSDGSIVCDEEEEEEEEQDTVLQCTSSICQNPNNLRCPSNYSSGTVNGNRVCVKNNNEEDDEPPVECVDDSNCETQKEIAAIKDAKNGIMESVYELSDTFESGFNRLTRLLDEKLSNGNGSGNGSGNDNYPSDVDTSGFQSDMPFQEKEINNKHFDQNIFNSNAQCPSDRNLELNFLGHGFSYTFSFQYVCEGLTIIGYFILTMCYLYSAMLVVKE